MWTVENIGSLILVALFVFASLSLFSAERERVLVIARALAEKQQASTASCKVAGDVMLVDAPAATSRKSEPGPKSRGKDNPAGVISPNPPSADRPDRLDQPTI